MWNIELVTVSGEIAIPVSSYSCLMASCNKFVSFRFCFPFFCHCCWHCRSHCLWLFTILVYLLSVVTTWMVQGLHVSILYIVLWLVLCGDTLCLWKWSCLFCKQSLVPLQVSWFYGFATRGDIYVRIRAGFHTFPSLMFVDSALHSSLFYYGFF